MKMCRAGFLIVTITLFMVSQPFAKAQSSSGSGTTAQSQTQTPTQTAPPSSTSSSATSVQPGLTYRRPTNGEKLKNFAFDAFGPYAIIGSAAAAGIQQWDTAGNSHNPSGIPPDWGQGWDSYGARVGSNFGINLVTQTARYTMAEILREDTIYYRCECTGIIHRTEHALISTVTARRGEDGHRMISFSQIAAPYAGTEAAALLWYPNRYDAMDGFRMGNYNLLVQAGLNLALEFIYGGPHTLLSHHHVPVLSNATGSKPNN
ncbi:MAG TPA: hypothetical protein VN881_01395 [Candidatus Acidoferrales bacterium]|nr:hypothetical protein [Candidatus Acidoferrales bacterium]